MLKILIRKQLLELNRSFFYDQRKGIMRSKSSSILFIVLYALLMIVVIGGMFTALSVLLCSAFVGLGLNWLYFDMMALMALLLGVFGGVFNTYSSLYKAKDNDLMLSLPIPTRYILITRLLGVYLMGLMFSAVVIVPAVIVYFVVAKPAFAGVVGSVMLVIIVSVIVFILSCILGWVVAKISSKLRSKSLIIVVLSLAFFALYYFVCFNAYELIQELILNALTVGEIIMEKAHILYTVGQCGAGDWASLGIVTVSTAALLALTYYVLSRSFIKIATTPDKVAKTQYREKTVKAESVSSALLRREASRYLASPTYMLNCSLGTPLMLIAGVIILVKSQALTDVLEFMELSPDFITVIFAVGVCLLSSMNDLSAPSVSLEGKSIWIAQSLPVSPKQVLSAKLKLHMLLTAIPAVFCTVCFCIVLSPSALIWVLCIALAILFTLFNAGLGLVVNLKKPNLNWQTETAAVKQSIGVMIALLGSWAIAFLLAVVYYLLSSKLGAAAYLAIASAVIGIASALMLRWINTRGSEIFRYL